MKGGSASHLDSLDLGAGMRIWGSCWPSTTLPVRRRTESAPAEERNSRKSEDLGWCANAPTTGAQNIRASAHESVSDHKRFTPAKLISDAQGHPLSSAQEHRKQ